MRQTEKAQPESEYEEGVPLLSVRADAEQWVAAIDRAGSAARARVTQRAMALADDVDSVLLRVISRLCEEAVLLPVLEPLLGAAASVCVKERPEEGLHAVLQASRELPQDAAAFSLRPRYRSPSDWSSTLVAFRAIGGGDGQGWGPSLLPWAVDRQLTHLLYLINAQYIEELLLPGREPDAPPLPKRVLGADDLLPILCFVVARGCEVELSRPKPRRLTTLLAWSSAMAEGGGSEGEWVATAMHAALSHLVEVAAAS